MNNRKKAIKKHHEIISKKKFRMVFYILYIYIYTLCGHHARHAVFYHKFPKQCAVRGSQCFLKAPALVLDGVSAFRGSCLPFSPIVLLLVSLCRMVLPFVGWCARLPDNLVSLCLPLYPFLYPSVGWCARLPEGLVSLCLPLYPFSCFPLLDGASAFPCSSPIVPLFLLSLCWMVCPP